MSHLSPDNRLTIALALVRQRMASFDHAPYFLPKVDAIAGLPRSGTSSCSAFKTHSPHQQFGRQIETIG